MLSALTDAGASVSWIENAPMASSRAVVPAVAGFSNTWAITSLRLASCSKRWAWTDAQYTQPFTRDTTVAPSSRSARDTAGGVHDGVEGGGALAQDLGLVHQEAVVVRDLGLGMAFFQDGDLFGRGLFQVNHVQPGLPFQRFIGEAVQPDGVAGRGGGGVGRMRRGRRGGGAGGTAGLGLHCLQAGHQPHLVRQEGHQLRQRDHGGRGRRRRQGLERGLVALDGFLDQLAREFQDGGQARVGGVRRFAGFSDLDVGGAGAGVDGALAIVRGQLGRARQARGIQCDQQALGQGQAGQGGVEQRVIAALVAAATLSRWWRTA